MDKITRLRKALKKLDKNHHIAVVKAAEMLGVSPRTVYMWLSASGVKPIPDLKLKFLELSVSQPN